MSMGEASPLALIDCNNFYVSCERAFNRRLEGVPVLVLSHVPGRVPVLVLAHVLGHAPV